MHMNAALRRQLQRILTQTRPEDENAAALDTGSFEIAHALCRERAYILLSTPLSSDMDVLELGAGCGTRTRFLAERVRSVTALDEDADILELNAFRNRDLTNINYRPGPWKETLAALPAGSRFSLAVLVDVEPAPELLAAIRPLLADDGLLLIACDNPQGVKFWSDPNQSPPDRSDILCELQARLAAAGFAIPHVAYPYPDHRFPLFIYTDAFLPAPGHCYFNCFTWDREQPSFDSTALWNRLIEDDRFPACSNSYLLHARPATCNAPDSAMFPEYTKICAIRSAALRICTSVFRQRNGTRFVEKKPLEASASAHVAAIARWNAALSKQYAGVPLSVNRGETAGDACRLEFLEAKTLYDDIISAIRRNDEVSALRLMENVFGLIRSAATAPFAPTPAYAELFGSLPLPDTLYCSPVTDVDMNFDNFFLTPPGEMTLIDYEFTFDFPIPVDFPIFRALFYFFRSNPWIVTEHPSFVQEAWKRAHIDRSLFDTFAKQERNFQLHVHGPHDALSFFHPFNGNGVRGLFRRFFSAPARAKIWPLIPSWLRMKGIAWMNRRAGKQEQNSSYAPEA